MNKFPLLRVKISNEYIMTGIVITLMLFIATSKVPFIHVPLIFALALLIDTIFNYIRYKKIKCGVSSAVTSLIILVLLPELMLLDKAVVLIVSLVIGKHLQGGTGKNILNPAVFGLVFAGLVYGLKSITLAGGYYLILPVILSVVYVKFRPYASLGLLAGMSLSIFLKGDLSLLNLLSSGTFFYSFLIITDPTTVSRRPIFGVVASFLVGFIGIFVFNSYLVLNIGILIFNTISFVLDKYSKNSYARKVFSFKNNKKFSFTETEFVDYTETLDEVISEKELSKEQILTRIKDNGVYGMGGGAFNTSKKIETIIKSTEQSKHLIINAVECDPGLIHDDYLLKHHSKEIEEGIDILKRCINFNSITLASKKKVNDSRYLKLMPDYYPVGYEKILVKEILDLELKENHPSTLGVLVLNLQSIYAIYQAVTLNKKIDSKYITASNLLTKEHYVSKVNLDSNIREQFKVSGQNIFSGGGIMQASLCDEEARVDKTTNLIAIGQFPRYKESELCSKCGLCEIYCPSSLKVRHITDFIQAGDINKAIALNKDDCISCGTCSFICLAGRNLSQTMQKT